MSEGRRHKCVRVDAILLALSKLENWHIKKMLEGLHRDFKNNVLKKVLYYIIWGGQDIWRYDVDTEEWSRALIRNREDLNRQDSDWCFHWNSRICYLPNGSLMIIGGVSKRTRS